MKITYEFYKKQWWRKRKTEKKDPELFWCNEYMETTTCIVIHSENNFK